MMINIFYQSLFNEYIDEIKINLLTQGSILSNQISKDYDNLEKEAVFNYVSEYVKEMSLKLDSRILIINREKEVVVDSHDVLKGFIIDKLKEIDIALTGASNANLYNIKDVGKTMYVSVPITNRDSNVLGSIFISKNADDIFISINSTMKKVMLISLFGLLITGLVSFIISDVLSRPIERMTEAVRSITMGDFRKKIKITSTDEISNLGNAFNLMSTRLYQVDEQRAKFVANVSHELRTPLTSIKIISEALLENKKDLPKEIVTDFLQDIDSEVDRLNKIIDSLLYLVDMEKKELELELKLTYVNYLLRNVIKSLNPLAEKKNIKIHLIERDRIQVSLDQDKIKQAIINILGNAIKFTPENGDVYVQIYSSPKDSLTIEIEDTGIGIPENDIKYILDIVF
ncbi:MAG: histidine kinase dimerization/phospho-acceptor domain-containing protein, partial [Bacillota bacterium]|nr:histidine kinase dimerization/phospho-acceptor domain-containing protein [Bacillota bacterium]